MRGLVFVPKELKFMRCDNAEPEMQSYPFCLVFSVNWLKIWGLSAQTDECHTYFYPNHSNRSVHFSSLNSVLYCTSIKHLTITVYF